MKKRNKALVFEINTSRDPIRNLILLRATLTSEYTKIDMGYSAIGYYVKGGWIKISPDTHLRIKGVNKKFDLIDTDNIPISPDQHHFESTKDWQYFTLYFRPIPQEDCIIDLIEAEDASTDDFNIYDIPLQMKDSKEIIEL